MDNFKTKILVVDDDPISVLALKEHLETAGYTVITAANGQQAWQLLTESDQNFSLVIADRLMPGIDGIELTRLIHTHVALQHIPVIMLTGTADKDEMIAAHKSGVYDFLHKPVEPELLFKVTERALRDRCVY